MSQALAGDFPPISFDEWRAAVRAKLDGDQDLVSRLEDGLVAGWLYTREDALAPDPGGVPGHAPYTRGTRVGEPWAIRQQHGLGDRARVNGQILEDLEGGATEVLLRIDPAGQRGIPVSTVDELDEVLDGVYLELAPVALEAGLNAHAVAALLAAVWDRREVDPGAAGGSLRIDPIGSLARTEATEAEYEQEIGKLMAALPELRTKFPRAQLIGVDTTPYADAGAGAVDELAIALATGIAYLRASEGAGIAVDDIPVRLEFTFSTGPDQFLEIAKLRAARRLWANVLGHCGIDAKARRSRTYATTSRRMVSSLDPWVNILRATTAGFAAAVGGADGITVLAFDEPVGEPGPLGRRVARNTQLILGDEASLARVADPSGGSWYVEALTDQLASKAWAELQEIERGGGIVRRLADGALTERLEAATDRRADELSRRRRLLTGVNSFPLLGDDGVERRDQTTVAVRDEPARSGGLVPIRDASAFERLRERAQALADDGDSPPRILLACTGPLAAHVSIANWAKSFFEAGGIATIASGQVADDAQHCALLSEHELTAVAVCPGRGESIEAQERLIGALRRAGARTIYLAGTRDAETASRVGADVAVADGVDMVAILGELLDRFERDAAGGEA
jgi:methylmalonyl-CoA mutase